MNNIPASCDPDTTPQLPLHPGNSLSTETPILPTLEAKVNVPRPAALVYLLKALALPQTNTAFPDKANPHPQAFSHPSGEEVFRRSFLLLNTIFGHLVTPRCAVQLTQTR